MLSCCVVAQYCLPHSAAPLLCLPGVSKFSSKISARHYYSCKRVWPQYCPHPVSLSGAGEEEPVLQTCGADERYETKLQVKSVRLVGLGDIKLITLTGEMCPERREELSSYEG